MTYTEFQKTTQNKTDLLQFVISYNDLQLEELLIDYNSSYRKGNQLISDPAYDVMYDYYISRNPNDIKVNQNWVQGNIPIKLTGLIQCKSIAEVEKWKVKHNISDDTLICLTGKYDGNSECKNELTGEVWSGGDKATHLTKLFENVVSNYNENFYSYGEAIMKKELFETKYSKTDKNARNLVTGKLNAVTKNPQIKILNDISYVRYGLVPMSGNLFEYDKSEQLDKLNQINETHVPYRLIKISELTEEFIIQLYNDWNKEFELDGIIIDINDKVLREKIGFNSTDDQCEFCIKYKGDFEEIKETKIIGIHGKVNRFGVIVPVYDIEPVKLDGATVTNVTSNNFKFIYNYKIQVGDIIKIKRSGKVIPKIIGVNGVNIPQSHHFITEDEYDIACETLIENRKDIVLNKVITHCTSCDTLLEWNETNVHKICINDDCSGKKFKMVSQFFESIKIESFAEATIKQVYDKGYDTTLKILNMSINDFLTVDGFQESKAKKVFNNIHKALSDVTIGKIQHASGYFENLGSKTLNLIDDNLDNNLNEVNGLADKTIKIYKNNIKNFDIFFDTIENFVTLQQQIKIVATSNKYENRVFVFSGVRDKELEQVIQENCGTIASGISKNVTDLIVKDKTKLSSKIKKAQKLNITITNLIDFK